MWQVFWGGRSRAVCSFPPCRVGSQVLPPASCSAQTFLPRQLSPLFPALRSTHSSTGHLWVTRNSLPGLRPGSALEMETQRLPQLFPLRILSCAELFLQPDAPTLWLSDIQFEALTHRAVSRPGSLQAPSPAAPNTGCEQTQPTPAPQHHRPRACCCSSWTASRSWFTGKTCTLSSSRVQEHVPVEENVSTL